MSDSWIGTTEITALRGKVRDYGETVEVLCSARVALEDGERHISTLLILPAAIAAQLHEPVKVEAQS